MLPAETSVEACRWKPWGKARIIEAAEQEWPLIRRSKCRRPPRVPSPGRSSGRGARPLATSTMTGDTVSAGQMLATASAVTVTTEPATCSRLTPTWDAETFLVPPVACTDDMARQVEATLRDTGRCAPSDLVVSVADTPSRTPSRTNASRVYRFGDAIQSWTTPASPA